MYVSNIVIFVLRNPKILPASFFVHHTFRVLKKYFRPKLREATDCFSKKKRSIAHSILLQHLNAGQGNPFLYQKYQEHLGWENA